MNEAHPVLPTQATKEQPNSSRSLRFSSIIQEFDSIGQISFVKEELRDLPKSSKPKFQHEIFSPEVSKETKVALVEGWMEKRNEDGCEDIIKVPISRYVYV